MESMRDLCCVSYLLLARFLVPVDLLLCIRKEDVDIKIDSNLITIKGKKEEVKEIKDVNFFTRERFYGNFQRSITLPFAIKSDKINASLKNGVLIIEAPKAEASSSQVIEIKG